MAGNNDGPIFQRALGWTIQKQTRYFCYYSLRFKVYTLISVFSFYPPKLSTEEHCGQNIIQYSTLFLILSLNLTVTLSYFNHSLDGKKCVGKVLEYDLRL